MDSVFPDLPTPRLTARIARPGMEAAMARFLHENFEGHLDRWSPPATIAFFTAAFWQERLAAALEDFHAGRAVRFVLQDRLGFAREGLARDYLFIDGAWRDHVLAALTNPRFDAAWVEPSG